MKLEEAMKWSRVFLGVVRLLHVVSFDRTCVS